MCGADVGFPSATRRRARFEAFKYSSVTFSTPAAFTPTVPLEHNFVLLILPE